MKQGIQSTLKNTALKEFGCYFLCLLRWAELERGIELDEDQIEFICNYSVATRELMKKGLPIKAFLIALKADKPCLRAVPM